MEKIKCNLCEKEMVISRLISHIKFSHKDYTTEKYVEEFGEFRPKEIKKTNKLNLRENSDNKIICKICGSVETTISLKIHIRWSHKNWNTKKYIQEFGEFRPKVIEDDIKKENSEFECKICNVKVKSNQHLMYHITKVHPEITQSDYIVKYILNNKHPLCKCGCG